MGRKNAVLQWIVFAAAVGFSFSPEAQAARKRPLITCSEGAPSISQMSMARSEPDSPVALLPASGYPELTLNILETWAYTAQRLAKLERIKPLLIQALNSEALRDFVLNHKYRGKSGFSDNNGLTNEQIYDAIRQAAEGEFTNEPYVVEFSHELYYSRRNTVGQTWYGQPWIQTNRKYFDPWSEAEIAGHLAHEWTHLLGFSHYQTWYNSVPYALGDEVARIATQLAKQP